MVNDFIFAKIPRIVFGEGKSGDLPNYFRPSWRRCLVLTGKKSFTTSKNWQILQEKLNEKGIVFFHDIITQEPSPQIIDELVSKFIQSDIDIVITIGGGSVLDTGKAVSAMMTVSGKVKDYLEGVGSGKEHPGSKLPFIAVPTTSGTGSEATKNAVISDVGQKGYKKSLRHDNFVPDLAIVDPLLTISCPPSLTAACGMDAFTQLIESYLSVNSSPLTDTLALSGMRYLTGSLEDAFFHPDDLKARSGMCYASLLSGITLANAGLGVVHGFASPIGGFFDIPHGVVCGSLMGESIAANIRKIKAAGNNEAMRKYADIGRMFTEVKNKDDQYYCEVLVGEVSRLVMRLGLPMLGEYGISEKDIPKIIDNTSQKNNPVVLDREDLANILIQRIG